MQWRMWLVAPRTVLRSCRGVGGRAVTCPVGCGDTQDTHYTTEVVLSTGSTEYLGYSTRFVGATVLWALLMWGGWGGGMGGLGSVRWI